MYPVNDPRPPTYGANTNDFVMTNGDLDEHSTAAAHELRHEVIILRQLYQQCLQQIEYLAKENESIFGQYQTLQMLYIELKNDRNRIARLFNTSMRELVYLQRTVNNNNNIQNGGNGGSSQQNSLNRSQRKKRKRRSVKNNYDEKPCEMVDSYSGQIVQQQPESSYNNGNNNINNLPDNLSDLFKSVEPSYCNMDDLGFDLCLQTNTTTTATIVVDNNNNNCNNNVENQQLSTTTVQRSRSVYYQKSKPIIEFRFNNIVNQYRSLSLNDTRFSFGLSKANLMYPTALQQCVEFSKSLLDMTDNKDKTTTIKAIDWKSENDDKLEQDKPCIINAEQFIDHSELENNDIVVKVEDAIPIEQAIPIENPVININSQLISVTLDNNYCPKECVREIRIPRLKQNHRPIGIFFDCSLQSGVVVKEVTPGSEAERSGIVSGMRVLEVCGINVRKTNFEIANRILSQCKEPEIVLKVLTSDTIGLSSQLSMVMSGSESIPSNNNNNLPVILETAIDTSDEPQLGEDLFGPAQLRRTCTLTRREAFKKKNKCHKYFERKQFEHQMLYQSCHLAVSMPRRINVNMMCLAEIKLLGGNAVGIFVHSIVNRYLTEILQTGDQLLEYNNFDLTKATAEDAAIELAKPATDAVLVAYFNIEMYNQIRQNSIGDSFYIRTKFSRQSTNKSFQFQKDDIFYIDNTMFDGKPGYWRAWRVDRKGNHTECGFIPSKYTADCELLKQNRQQGKSMGGFRLSKFWTFFRLNRLFSRMNNGYTKLTDTTRVLASFSYPCADHSDNGNGGGNSECSDPICNIRSYQMIRKILVDKPRPVLLFGPLSYFVAKLMALSFPEMFQQCAKKDASIEEVNADKENSSTLTLHGDRLFHCTHRGTDQTYQCISLTNLNQISEQNNCHPIISVELNTVSDFRKNEIFPIVIGLQFKSAKHIRDTVIGWNRNRKNKKILPNISIKMAKAMYSCMEKMENDFRSEVNYYVNGINLPFMFSQIIEYVNAAQKNNVQWMDVK